jgi:GNAT superfamily N-acetyltransferase
MAEQPTDTLEIRRIRADEWRALRVLRLEALQNSPRSYGSTYAEEVRRSVREWRERAAAGALAEDQVAVVAVADGAWVGMARGYLELPTAHLVGVYVTPAWRRRGVGAAVSLAIVTWARERGAAEILVTVSDWNAEARRVYEGLGFVANGVRGSLPWDASVTESELRLVLT